MKIMMKTPPSTRSLPSLLFTLVNQSKTPTITRRTTAAFAISSAALSTATVTRLAFVANMLAKL